MKERNLKWKKSSNGYYQAQLSNQQYWSLTKTHGRWHWHVQYVDEENDLGMFPTGLSFHSLAAGKNILSFMFKLFGEGGLSKVDGLMVTYGECSMVGCSGSLVKRFDSAGIDEVICVDCGAGY